MQQHIDTAQTAKDTVVAITLAMGTVSFVQAVAAFFVSINPILFGFSMIITIVLGAPKVARVVRLQRFAARKRRRIASLSKEITHD